MVGATEDVVVSVSMPVDGSNAATVSVTTAGNGDVAPPVETTMWRRQASESPVSCVRVIVVFSVRFMTCCRDYSKIVCYRESVKLSSITRRVIDSLPKNRV